MGENPGGEPLPAEPTAAQIDVVIRRAAKEFNQCTRAAHGTVVVRIGIGANGIGSGVFSNRPAGGTLNDGYDPCISMVIDDLRFPRTEQGAVVTRTLRFPMK